MYELLKSLAKSFIPKRLLFKHEVFFRRVFAFYYHGKKYRCNTCNHSLGEFIELKDHDLLCPFCGSRSRTRKLYELLQERSLLNGRLLHFSPSRSLYRIFNKNSNIEYYSTDFEDEFIAKYRFDITQIDCEDSFFDLIICYHILEHILEDKKAMQELYRVLKPNGTCFVQTPFKEGETIYEDPSITTEKERLSVFGQEDHVRVYSVFGLVSRLENVGFEVKTLSFSEDKKNHFGYLTETVLELKK